MKIGLGCDHGGYNLKSEIIKHLQSKDIECVDYGTNNDLDSVDYPIYGESVANAVVNKDVDYGIVCCGTGIGISLAANKVPGIRCAVVSDVFSAKMSKAHNNANMLSLGERVIGKGLALEIVDAWINTEFEGDRHSRRVDMINKIEEKHSKQEAI
ncbi:ribose 5-phosphate isomerase B [Romboutsia ilealis]|uniref:Ribose 5-phosphate isomerase B n=1 Tax=Romboutsia faecis TaxID=2764597 RepID=A0ABR7JT00_9FIRM|nr:ribose 5-phosphate isomerase B [Romboutsia faecis]MBC5998043.1 ribose 5-phosphate isomerase B [Romboutsia faecis]MRN25734.1 ribose 5-phosphate isomerase B [Romboutsia ilealis]